MCKKLIFTGPESCGKTTISEKMSKIFNLKLQTEYSRIYLNNLNRKYNLSDIKKIAIKHHDLEKKNHTKKLIIDTDLITLKIWSDFKFGFCDSYIESVISNYKRENRYYILTKPDVEWKFDPQRENQYDREAPKISKYAFGKDYHIVIKKKLKKFLKFINREIGEVQGRVFVDSAPVMDKVWASKSGLGWIGKNTNLISKKVGSFFFIAELIIDLELVYDPPTTDHCGNCTACIDACPTDALIEPYQIDGSKCISYLTIELKEKIPSEFEGKMDQWVFGCDVCQSVCPWNRFSKPNEVSEFEPDENLISMNKNDWEELTEEVFNDLFKNSAIKRTNFSGIKRNIKFLKQ